MMCPVDEDRDAEELRAQRRRDALVAFLWSGTTGSPSPGIIVGALGEARAAVAMHQERRRPLDGWLADEVRLRGIRENAAVLAALELPEWRDRAAEIYRNEHPERREVLDAFLAVLEQHPQPEQ
jgi:hypothetical protein